MESAQLIVLLLKAAGMTELQLTKWKVLNCAMTVEKHLPLLQLVQFCSISLLEAMTNGVRFANSGMWLHLTHDKEKWWPTWFLSSSLEARLASRSELIELSCSTSWAFSTFISCRWELRASTWADRSLTSVSNLPMCNWLSVEPTRYSMIKKQNFYILIFLLTTGTQRSFPHSLTWECITLMMSLVQSWLQARVFALCGSEFLAHLLQSLL